MLGSVPVAQVLGNVAEVTASDATSETAAPPVVPQAWDAVWEWAP